MNNRRASRVASQIGFTLLELLISITLLGLILVLLFGGLRLGVRSWDAAQQQVDSLNAVRSVEGFLRREMALANPHHFNGPNGQRLAFLGSRKKISFVAQLPSRIGVGGLYAVSLEFDQVSNGQRIVWKQLPLSPQIQDFLPLQNAPEMLLAGSELSGVDDIWLTYFGQASDGAAPHWTDHWENEAQLPLLIRIQVALANGSVSPDFVVATMLTSEPRR